MSMVAACDATLANVEQNAEFSVSPDITENRDFGRFSIDVCVFYMILTGFHMILNLRIHMTRNVSMYMNMDVRICMTRNARIHMTTNVRPRLRMCGRNFRMSRFPGSNDFPNFRVPPNFPNVMFFLVFMFFRNCSVPPKFQDLPIF